MICMEIGLGMILCQNSYMWNAAAGEMAPGIEFMYDVSLNFLRQEQVVDAHRSVCQCGI